MSESALPLTYAEAQTRAALVRVVSYTVDLDLTLAGDVFGSTTVIRFTCTDPTATTFVELRAAQLISATLNDRPVDLSAYVDNRLTLAGIDMRTDADADNELVVEAEIGYSGTGEGMHRYVDPVDGETYIGAYVGVDNAQRVFANFDQPDLKAPIHVRAVAPVGWTVLSNGIGHQDAGTGRWDFAATPPIATYLMVLVAGPLHSVITEHRGIPFGLHCRRSLAAYLDRDADEILDITRSCFDRYLELFDEPYPFDSYDQAFVPELNWGAMETAGCITFRDDFVYRSAVTDLERQYRGTVIAHEMAHMWFGDLVTMRWWDDLWLSESFAEYMGFQVLADATRFTGNRTSFAIARKAWGYAADQRPSTHPVAARLSDVTDTERALANFDGISYAKGASVLAQLVAWLGDDVFLAGVNDFLTGHRFGVATLSDLLDALDRASGLDVHRWSSSWLLTTGVDTLRVVRGPGDDSAISIEHPGLRPHRVEIGWYDRSPDDATRLILLGRTRVTLEAGIRSTQVRPPVGETAPDLVLVNDQDLTYGKVRLDAQSWTAVEAGLASLADPLSRAVVWTAARDMTRDGELAAVDYLALTSEHLPAEDDVAIVEAVLRFARHDVVDRYLDPRRRREALNGLGDVARAILERTDQATAPGLRLVAVRAVIDSALSLDNIGDLRSCLTSGEIPEGPALDADLRWRILLRLCILSAAEPGEIDAELAHDTSGTGPENAARCLAALPSLAAKNAAWRRVFGAAPGDDQLSSYLVEATMEGFWQPEQSVLLAPFVPRYFPAAVDISTRRGASVTDAVAQAGFPFHVVEESILRAAEQCRAATGISTALSRALADQVDDYRRALRVRSVQV